MKSFTARNKLPTLATNRNNQRSSPIAYERTTEDPERQRRTPILHMQFDELATSQLHYTYNSKFFKK